MLATRNFQFSFIFHLVWDPYSWDFKFQVLRQKLIEIGFCGPESQRKNGVAGDSRARIKALAAAAQRELNDGDEDEKTMGEVRWWSLCFRMPRHRFRLQRLATSSNNWKWLPAVLHLSHCSTSWGARRCRWSLGHATVGSGSASKTHGAAGTDGDGSGKGGATVDQMQKDGP